MNKPVFCIEVPKTTKDELENLLINTSKDSPCLFFCAAVGFTKIWITGHNRRVSNNYGEDSYRIFGGFHRAGKIAKPDSAWMRQYNHIPVSD